MENNDIKINVIIIIIIIIIIMYRLKTNESLSCQHLIGSRRISRWMPLYVEILQNT